MTEQNTSESALSEGKRHADNIFDTTLIEKAISQRLKDFETLVGLWDAAVADGVPEEEMERLMKPIAESWVANAPPSKGNPQYPLSRKWIARMRHTLNNDHKHARFANYLVLTFYQSALGMTRCQVRAAFARREMSSNA